MKRCAQFRAESDDLVLPEMDDRRKDSDAGFRARTRNDRVGERVTERLRTVGITGTVFFDGAQIHTRCADGFCPRYPQAEKERISEGYVRDRYVDTVHDGVGNGYVSVCQRGFAHLPECVSSGGQATTRRYAVVVGDVVERPAFAGVRPVAVVEEKKREIEILAGDGGSDAAVQPAAEQHDGELFHAPLTVATVRFMYDARSSMSE